MGGGGGDDYSAKQAEIERNKQKARDALNLSFGISGSGAAPSRSDFTSTRYVDQMLPSGTDNGGDVLTKVPTDAFDQAGYDKALADFNGSSGEAQKNKAAREALYGNVRQNAFDAGKRGLDESRDNAARDQKFALFAQGLNGGSVDIDQGATLGRTYNKGLLDLGAKADAARTGLESSDENTRLGLLQSIDAGMDQGSALSSALNQLKTNNDRASAEAQGTTLGDLFAGTGLLYTKSNLARGKQDAGDWWASNYGSARPKSAGSNGIVTQT
ncbi:hypothetical protein [Rhizobacter sp. OV335]|uniref:hypothetical protein n=1 Tax=Rhizobacter sp. OV335 TaxID=1500264 RepID=UPI000923A8C6|nr:hypothetical protein [Rhizobacter sp. OV335]SHN40011.1 hypothetical protein SAMN02787076_06153 [Rhizobacter sp. OV335]